jgi:hypothetical protein
MLDALWRAGVEAEYFLAEDKDHGGVNDDLTSGDAMSQLVLGFLTRRVGTSGSGRPDQRDLGE